MGKLDGKVAFITGAARGQGRSHAVRLAQEGADVIGVDLCAQIATVPYPMATPEDLEQTVKEVEAEGRRIFAAQADVRDPAALRQAFEQGTTQIGPVDIVLANAGIGPSSPEPTDDDWHDVIAVNLTGVYNTVRVAIPSMIERGQGGAIVLTSSTGGLIGVASNASGMLGYTAAKHGVIGLMRSWANYLAPHNIRVNSVAPTGVRTPMTVNDHLAKLFERDPGVAQGMQNALPVDMVEAIDISNAIVYLVSDDGRYVTGTTLAVDAGMLNRR
ncbi:MAG: mycofactocin-coupled SDR family oxidoreductase [Acidimicrobiaceae bacterium]|nr:mycofactocin-coupled SDR family oxidoreductase [Acidimicrobiaceae bacterium]